MANDSGLGLIDLAEPVDASVDGFAPRSTSDSRELGLTVYRNVWDEFYSWEPEECKQLISSLSRAAAHPSAELSGIMHDILTANLAFGAEDMEIDQLDDPGECSVTIWNKDGSLSSGEFYCEDIILERFFPYPAYQSCTPISKNISHIDEVTNLPFLPYADDDQFAAVDFSMGFEFLAWQVDFPDPDFEVIQLETARRLHYGHDLSLTDLDSLGFLRTIRKNNQSGLIWDTSQRDILRWPGDLSPYDNLPTNYECPEDDLQTRVNYTIKVFCPSLNCVQPHCPTHTEPYPSFNPVKPALTSTGMILREGNPCGEYCFRLINDLFADSVYWETEAEMETLHTVLKIMPDLSPCELAIICRKPCREIYVQRTKIIPDEDVSDILEAPVARRAARLPFVDDYHLRFTPVSPCHHKGPCDSQSNCACFRERQHCQRSCRCPVDLCKNRWKGCDCKKTSKACTLKCKCLRAKRECDPELCKSCGALNFEGSQKGCQNIKIQRGETQVMEIKRGLHGLGAFATRLIVPDDFLGEYFGEIIPLSSPRDTIMHYTHLNYVFELNKMSNLDAMDVGNETRYINHAVPPDTNCDARVLLVHGEHRIGIFAHKRIKPGEEIFLDYGARYWDDHPKV